MEKVTSKDIAGMIDLSLLNPTFTHQDVVDGLNLAKEYNVVSVCVRPCDIALTKEMLAGTDIKVTTVIGFPHGTHTTETKVFETEQAIDLGCVEVDVVQNISYTLSGEYDKTEADLKAVVDAAHAKGALVKVIFENAYLNDDQKVKLCEICARVGADFTKTATGYAPSGATLHDLKLMRANTPENMKVKAAGGVRTLDAALKVLAVGGSRFGCTRTKTIMEEALKREAEGTLVLPEITEDTEL